MRRLLILALISSVGLIAQGDIKTTYLPERPTATLSTALSKAKREVKAVFLILYDDRETVQDTLNYFFDSPVVKKSFQEHFVVCVRDRKRPDVEKYNDPSHAWNRARFVVLNPDGDQIYAGRFLRNDETGLRETSASVKAWQAVRPIFGTPSR